MNHQHNPAVDLAPARERMLSLLRTRIRDQRVIGAMAAIPRECFVPPELRPRAYDDAALPIGEDQTISQPLMVALMVEALGLKPADHVLEVGTGSGYAAALLSQLARDVTSTERVPSLRHRAQAALASLGIANVRVCPAADELGCGDRAPYDAIIVSAGAPHVPHVLIDQLGPAGRLVVPVGNLRAQELFRAMKTAHGLVLTRLGPCVFVALIGRGAWSKAAVRDAVISPKVR